MITRVIDKRDKNAAVLWTNKVTQGNKEYSLDTLKFELIWATEQYFTFKCLHISSKDKDEDIIYIHVSKKEYKKLIENGYIIENLTKKREKFVKIL